MSRLIGYVRVSQVNGRAGDRFMSPAIQEEAIRGYAAAHGDALAEVFVELDESGARADRPLLLLALARIETGEAEGLIVAKLDRFGRSLIDGLQAIDRIQRAGGTFASVADGLDLRTDSGRLMLRFLMSVAEFEHDRVRTTWRIASERAVARGVYVGSVPPAGYRRRRDGRLAIDQTKAPAVQRLFAARADGTSISQVA